jgi:hypothetical protein
MRIGHMVRSRELPGQVLEGVKRHDAATTPQNSFDTSDAVAASDLPFFFRVLAPLICRREYLFALSVEAGHTPNRCKITAHCVLQYAKR